MSIEPGTPKLVMPRLIVRRYTLGANRFGDTSIPMEDSCRRGERQRSSASPEPFFSRLRRDSGQLHASAEAQINGWLIAA